MSELKYLINAVSLIKISNTLIPVLYSLNLTKFNYVII